MTTPITSAQIAEKSILDLQGRQTYLGNSFVLPQNGKSLTNTVETPFAYVKNPSTSSKSLFFFSRDVSSNNNPVDVRYYRNPTESAVGSATAAVNLRSGFQTLNTSVTSCYLSPSFSSNGTFLWAIPTTIYGLWSNVLFVIDPGDSLLLTGQQIGAGTTSVFAELCWYEI